MNGSQRAAVALGVGYVLGRRRKLRVATVLVVTTAVGGTSVGGLVMRRGAKMIVNAGIMDKLPPQVGELVDVVRGDLLGAGKAAASAAVSSRIDSLTDSLHDRAEALRNPGAVVAEGTEAAAGAARDTARGTAGAARGAATATAGAARVPTQRLRGRGRGADAEPDESRDDDYDDEDTYPEDDYEEGDYDEREPEPDEQDERPARPAASPGRRRPSVTRTRR